MPYLRERRKRCPAAVRRNSVRLGYGRRGRSSHHAGSTSIVVSEGGHSVADMSTHVCAWFEDSWPDHVCVCGARAIVIVDELGDTLFAVLEAPHEVPHQRLPLSA